MNGASLAATFRAGFALHAFEAFLRDHGGHDQSRDRIGPPQSKRRVQNQSDEKDGGKIRTELRLFCVRMHRNTLERVSYFSF